MAVCHVQPEQAFNLIFGYNDIGSEGLADGDADAGTNTLNGTAVPAGEVWIVTAASARNLTQAITYTGVGAFIAGAIRWLKLDAAPARYQGVHLNSWLVLEEDDYMKAVFAGCGAGNAIYFDYSYIIMKVTQ